MSSLYCYVTRKEREKKLLTKHGKRQVPIVKITFYFGLLITFRKNDILNWKLLDSGTIKHPKKTSSQPKVSNLDRRHDLETVRDSVSTFGSFSNVTVAVVTDGADYPCCRSR